MNRTFFHRSVSFLLAAVLTAWLAVPAWAEEDAAETATAPTGISVSLDYSRLTVSRTDKPTLTATITAQPEGASLPDGAGEIHCTWTSTSPSVAAASAASTSASVSAQDLGTADAAVTVLPGNAGAATITVQASVTLDDGSILTSDSAGCAVTVPGIVLSQSSISLHPRDTAALTATVYGDLGGIAWSSGNGSIATVSGGDTTAVNGVSVCTGTVTAVGAGAATVTAAASSGAFAECTVNVSEVTADVLYASADVGDPLSFSYLTSSLNNQCLKVLGTTLSYVSGLNVSTEAGTLYYGYISEGDPGAGVGSGENYYYNSGSAAKRNLRDVTFVSKSGFSGDTVIRYTGYDVLGNFFTGTIRVSVAAVSVISYSTSEQSRVDFQVSDFSRICLLKTGHELQSVTFILPSSSKGTLYYNYSGSDLDSKVSENTAYYRGKAPDLSNVTFVPTEGYAGTVSIDYQGRDTSGTLYSGRVEIAVSNAKGSSGTIYYSISQNQTVFFDRDDFDDLSEDLADCHLNYVRFTLPSSSAGTLYYNATSSGGYDGKVSSSQNYYRFSSPYLDNVSFVPASGWTGTVDIGFTGYSTDGSRFSGTVEVTVKSASATAGVISYATTAGTPLLFRTADFQAACSSRNAGSFVRAVFNLPASGIGQLRYDYLSDTQPGTAVSSSQSYAVSGTPSVSRVTFVPATGFTGTVALSYTGTDSRGTRYSGTVLITVSAAPGYFSDLGNYGWAEPSIEYLYETGVVYGTASGNYSPGAAISRGDFMLMLCRAFGFTASGGTGFADVPSDSVYADAIGAAQALGIARGNGSYFYPTAPLTREQAAVFLLRALRADGWTIADGQRSSLAVFSDSEAVSEYAVGAVASMVQLGVLQGTASGRLNPGGILTRAQMAVILYRALTL